MSQKKNEFDILDFATQASKVIEKNFKVLFGLFIAAVVGGTLWTLMSYQNKKKEMASFTELYKITKVYNQKKAEFEEAKAAKDEKNQKKEDKVEEATKDEAAEKDLVMASGVLEKDYPNLPGQLENFIKEHKGSNASGEAALTLSEIYDEYKQPEKGASALKDVLENWGSKNVLYYVMQMRAGDLYAGTSDCEKAISFWQVVANSKSFIAKQAQLKLGVCLQKVGRVEEAKQWFNQLQEEDPNSSEGFSAKRYLRFLKFKSKVEQEPSSDDKAQAQDAKKDQAS